VAVNCLLIAPLSETRVGDVNWGHPPLGLWRLKGWVEEHSDDINIAVCDPEIDNIASTLTSQHFEIIGFSLIRDSISSGTHLIAKTVGWIRKARELFPDALLIAGGIEAAEEYQFWFERTPLDMIIFGEGEEELLNICDPGRWSEAGKYELGLRGGIIRKPAKPITRERFWEYWSSMPWSDIPWWRYWYQTASLYTKPPWQAIKTIRLVPSTHCTLNCTFCSVAGIRRQIYGCQVKPVTLSGEQRYEQLLQIKEAVPEAETIYYCDDNTLWNWQDIEEFIRLYKAGSLGYRFLIQTHSGWLRKERVEQLAEIGVKHITVGVEACIERLRKTIRKAQTDKRIQEVIVWCLDNGIKPYYLLILFLPEMTIEELRETVDICYQWMLQGVQISIEPFLMPYRAAPVWHQDYTWQFKTICLDEEKAEYVRLPLAIVPKDPQVAQIFREFQEGWKDYLEMRLSNMPHRHKFKGATGQLMIEFVDELLQRKR
jgi:radical SAM superfamily enzyme YgiQ (UPF0313 family)